MGVVYEVVDHERDVHVALKTLRSPNAEALLRFKQEFRSLQDLQHPNLVNLGELIEEQGQWFFTMELVQGVDLLSWVRPFDTDPEANKETLDAVPRSSETMRMTRNDVSRQGRPLILPLPAGLAPLPLPDERRLREALAQLGRAVAALHAAGQVHRDLKPTNILVTPEGRLVLLDFGLATTIAEPQKFSDANIVGTADYMAPEQAASKPIGPEADWYSVGVILYEALTGRVPFSGRALDVLMDKQRYEPAPPRALSPDVPADLDALCADLLRFDPAARPSGRQILRRLGSESQASSPASHSGSLTQGAPFVGRERELEALHRGFEQVRAGEALMMLVRGESGVGKTVLVRRFCDSLPGVDAKAVVLAGRCYERESVPYKAFDGVVDKLASYMKKLPKVEAAAMLPRHTALLAQVFPVLCRVEPIAQAPRLAHEILDPQELRTRVFAALRELLARLADRQPVVVIIDDLQWADVDSLALLREILHPPDSPRILLVATQRLSAELPQLPGEVIPLVVERLAPGEARELAQLLVRGAGALAPIDPAAIADEAAGHPLFIDALVRHTVAVGERRENLKLEDALWWRINQLEPATKDLLALCAVAGGPLLQEIASEAAGLPLADFNRRAALLRVANLVRTTGARGTDTIETYHDRIRDAVLDNLDVETRRQHHLRLAVSLESARRADPEALVVHWRGAGNPSRAARYAHAAAEQAARALAFDRAARLFRLALELGPPEGAERWQLSERLGDALANAGRGPEAARAFLAAAEGANAAKALDLSRRAAEQLLISGHIDDGLATLRSVLAAVGMRMPTTPTRALLRLLFRRARIRLRGIRYTERDPSAITQNELTHIDVCWSVGVGLGLTDTIRGAGFNGSNLLLSLRTGEPYRISRALAMEAAYSGAGGNSTHKRTQRLIGAARAIAQKIDHPHALGFVQVCDGGTAYLEGRWRYACEALELGNRLMRDRCTDVSWELDSSELFFCNSLMYLGRLDELARRVPMRMREARDRGDLYGYTNLRLGAANLVWLLRDDVDTARRVAKEALEQWSTERWHLQHYYGVLAGARIDLYEGNPEAALARVAAAWPHIKAAMQYRIEIIRGLMHELQGVIRCEAARRDPARRAALLAGALGDAKILARIRAPYASPFALAIRAAAASVAGDRAAAQSLLEPAARGFEAADMQLHAHVARRAWGLLEGGEPGQAAVRATEDWLRAQGVAQPGRIANLFLPAIV
jgi:CheY-like chemotaxis protein